MADGAPELTVQTWRHPHGWIMVPFQVSLQGRLIATIGMMLNTGRPRSAIGTGTRDVLSALGHAEQVGPRTVNLLDVSVGGELVEPLPVQVSVGPGMLRLEGMLGLDFLDRYAEVRFDTRSLRLTLVRM